MLHPDRIEVWQPGEKDPWSDYAGPPTRWGTLPATVQPLRSTDFVVRGIEVGQTEWYRCFSTPALADAPSGSYIVFNGDRYDLVGTVEVHRHGPVTSHAEVMLTRFG